MPIFDFSSQDAYYCSLVKVDLNITLEFSLSVQPFLCFLNQSGDVWWPWQVLCDVDLQETQTVNLHHLRSNNNANVIVVYVFSQQVRSLGVQCVTQQGSSQTCCFVRVVAYIITLPVWRLVPRPFSGQDGSAQSVKCARHAGESNFMIQTVNCTLSEWLRCFIYLKKKKKILLFLNFISHF